MTTPPSASASPETPSAVMRALADEFARLARDAPDGDWLAVPSAPRIGAHVVLVGNGNWIAEMEPAKRANSTALFIAWCGTHRAIIEAALRAVADSAEEAPR